MAKNRKGRYLQMLLLAAGLLLVAWRFFKAFLPFDPPSGELCRFEARNQVEQLEFVEHALCRMECRDISEALVEDVYLHGAVNCKKGSVKNGNARYALEKRDELGDVIRIIVEDDHGQHVIITAIRLDREDKCACS